MDTPTDCCPRATFESMVRSTKNRVETVSGLVLAAGRSSRFGETDKLLSLANGRPLLEYALGAMAEAHLASVACILGANAEAFGRRIDFQGAQPIICPDWPEGQSASLRAGIEAFRDSDAVVITLGDQPLITAAAIDRVVCSRQAGAMAVQATYGGVPGHPVVLESALFDRLVELSGDRGAGGVIADVRPKQVACDGLGSPRDVDSAADLSEVSQLLSRTEAQ
jgi:molybdenum cofactor cytidylyltransferase